MSLPDFQRLISEAYLWHRALGNDVFDGSHCRFVTRTETLRQGFEPVFVMREMIISKE